MATVDSIAEQFEELGLEPTAEILAKSLDLCHTYNLNAGKFVEQWMAFSITSLNGADPTVEHLDDMERKQLSSIGRKSSKTTSSDASTSHSFYGNRVQENFEDNDVLDSYICKTPKSISKSQSRVHVTNDSAQSPQQQFDSPVIDTPKLASKPKGSAVYTFGNSALVNNINSTNFDGQKIKILQISPTSNKTEFLTFNDKFMLDTIVEKCWIKYDALYTVGHEIYKNYLKINPDVGRDKDEENDDVKNVNKSSQKLKRCVGRVYGDEKLVVDSTHFVGLDQSESRTVQLNFSKCQTCALFPGQTILIEGYNPRGDIFYVENIFAERQLERAPTPSIQDPLNMIIACGPYTSGQDLNYHPMRDLMHYVKDNKPNVLILIGPFIDANHQRIADGALKESFDLYFEKMISGVMDVVGSDTQVLIVSSTLDAHSTGVYPTHSYRLTHNYSNLALLPDPCTVDINGLCIGITSTDIVDHLTKSELTINAGDRIKRIVNYLLNQSSFYPLDPPEVGINLDTSLASKYAKIRVVPNILILPSSSKGFIRNINNCLVINPGRVFTENSGGTFGRTIISPATDEMPLSSYSFCQILKM